MKAENVQTVKSIHVNVNPYNVENFLGKKLCVNITILCNICIKESPKCITTFGTTTNHTAIWF